MVRVFMTNTENLPDPLEHTHWLEGLPEERKDKIKRIRRIKERRQSLGAGLLLEYAKKQCSGLGISNYNLSHSGNVVICAASNRPVGCDLEIIIGKAPIKVARRYFCKGEIDYLDTLKGVEQNEEFYRLWTIKESYVKMHGKGLAMGLDSFEVIPEKEVKIQKNGVIEGCHIKEYDLSGYKVTVCGLENEFVETIGEVVFE